MELNKIWIHLVPEFKALLDRRRDARSKLREAGIAGAVREFSFIYFYHDFSSPIRDYEESERWSAALDWAGLTDKDIDEKVIFALKKYEELIMKSTRSLRTYKSLLKMLDGMDEYYEKIDMTALTKQGELVHSPDKVASSVTKLDAMYVAVKNFEKRVEEDLKAGATGIRGTSTLGDNEEKKRSNIRIWSEADIRRGSLVSQEGASQAGGGGTFDSLGKMIREKENLSKEKVNELNPDDLPDQMLQIA